MKNEATKIDGLFMQWQALINNRTKRTKTGRFIVQGVDPINAALNQRLKIMAILYKEGPLSDWAQYFTRKLHG